MVLAGTLYELPITWFEKAAPCRTEGASEVEASVNDTNIRLGERTSVSNAVEDGVNENGATCIACGIGVGCAGFESSAEQREHFKTDWHRLNLKRRLSKQPPLTEEQFERFVQDDEVASISGSESSDDDEERDGGAEHDGFTTTKLVSRAPQSVFKSSDGSLFSVWRCLLLPPASRTLPPDVDMLSALRALRGSHDAWVVVLLRGGHFAAAAFRPRQRVARGEDPLEVVAHKTFHRYVVRAKAGGKQSTKDASGKFAKSAGARLRRYNEAALEREIRELLTQTWRPLLASAALVFWHTPSVQQRTLLAPLPDASSSAAPPLLSVGDPRLRPVPFVIRRPTLSEAVRVAHVLTSLYRVDEKDVMCRSTGGEDETRAVVADREGASQPTVSAAADAAAHEDASSVDRAAPDGSTSKAPQIPEAPLHRASRTGDAERVAALLAGGADPTARDSRGRTAYAVAGDKAVRDAFRRAMATAPDEWDWTEAGVPSALTADLEAAQKAKAAEKKAKLRAKEQERKKAADDKKAAGAAAAAASFDDELARATAEAAALCARLDGAKLADRRGGSSAQHGSGQKVGGTGAAAASGGARNGRAPASASAARPQARQQQQQPPAPVPVTPEEMAKRRELQAAAAEARMRSIQQAASQQKLW